MTNRVCGEEPGVGQFRERRVALPLLIRRRPRHDEHSRVDHEAEARYRGGHLVVRPALRRTRYRNEV